MNSISEWLTSIGLSDYISNFTYHEITESILPDLTDADLVELGLNIGHKKRFKVERDKLFRKRDLSGSDTSTSSNSPRSPRSYMCKIYYKQNVLSINADEYLTLKVFVKNRLGDVKLWYKDREGDILQLNNSEDFANAIRLSDEIIRIYPK